MQVTLTATFESVEELHDWVLKTAESLRPGPEPAMTVHEVMAGGETVITGADSHDTPQTAIPEGKPAKAAKPKRNRRTKAEMAAARAVETGEEAATATNVQAKTIEAAVESHPGNGRDATPEPEISEVELRRQYAEAFRGVLENRLEEGIALVKGAGLKRFSEGTLEQQVNMLNALGVSLSVE